MRHEATAADDREDETGSSGERCAVRARGTRRATTGGDDLTPLSRSAGAGCLSAEVRHTGQFDVETLSVLSRLVRAAVTWARLLQIPEVRHHPTPTRASRSRARTACQRPETSVTAPA